MVSSRICAHPRNWEPSGALDTENVSSPVSLCGVRSKEMSTLDHGVQLLHGHVAVLETCKSTVMNYRRDISGRRREANNFFV